MGIIRRQKPRKEISTPSSIYLRPVKEALEMSSIRSGQRMTAHKLVKRRYTPKYP